MIIQALCDFYDRRLQGSQWETPFGYSWERIGFGLILDRDGVLLGSPQDLRDHSTRVPQGRLCLVPWTNETDVRSSNIKANFLVDRSGYVVGYEAGKKLDRLTTARMEFLKLVQEVTRGVDDPGVNAVLAFLSRWNHQEGPRLALWEEMCGLHGGLIAFQLCDETTTGFVHERSMVKRAWADYLARQDRPRGICLVSGREAALQLQASQFKGIQGGQPTGTSLVSFNAPAFESYGRNKDDRNLNAPIAVETEFRMSTSLKYLLRNKAHRVQVGDATTLFWTARPTRAESFMGWVFESSDDAAEVRRLREWLLAARAGRRDDDPDTDVPFFILGLAAPAKARLSVRFWLSSTVGEMAERLNRHFDALRIERQFEHEPEYPTLHRLLRETAVFKKCSRNARGPVADDGNIPETLADAMARAVLTGERYAQSLLPTVLSRIRAEQADHDQNTGKPIPNVDYFRAALIKAALIRNHNLEVSMSLNKECTEPAYLLGRLFAVLERTQEAANPGLNTTIRDRYYGSASATPAAVFPILIRLNNHHLSKLSVEKPGWAVSLERLNREIIDKMAEHFPLRLGLKQQGMFGIGYYHQRNDLFTKKGNPEENRP